MGLIVALVVAVLCASCTVDASLATRFQERIVQLERRVAAEQGGTPLIVPTFGPEDVGADGTMEGNELAWIQRVTAQRRADRNAYPDSITTNPYAIRYATFNLKHPRIVAALLEARAAGVVVQVLVEASNVKSARYKVDDQFIAAGIPFFADRKLIPAAFDRTASFFSGVKTSNLMHNKMRIFNFPPAQMVVLSGSLNPGEESMQNDESLYTIRSPYIMAKYVAFFGALVAATERQWVNEWRADQPINILFSPSVHGYDLGAKILDWIDAETEFIFITVFSLNLFGDKVSKRNLYTSLAAAAARGVEIWIVTDRKQSDGPSGFGDIFDDMLRKLSPRIIMYEVINDVGMFNAFHLKDAIFGITNVKVVTDTTNWSASAMGSCDTVAKMAVVPLRSCKSAASTESALFIESAKLNATHPNAFGMRILRHHLGLLDKYWRQIPIQKTGDPAPWSAFERLVARFGDRIPFARTTVLVQCDTVPGEYVELRGGIADRSGDRAPELAYPNMLNGDTRPLKQSARVLTWDSGVAMDWTSDADNGGGKSYVNNGFGHSYENDEPFRRGRNWWKFLAYVDGKRGDWFEFKLVKTRQIAGEVVQWESDVTAQDLEISPADRNHSAEMPRRATTNHWGRLGYVTRAVFRTGDGARARSAAGVVAMEAAQLRQQ